MKDFKISCLPLTFYKEIRCGKMTVKQWSEIARAIGFDAIDINAFFLDEMTVEEVKALRKELALPVLMATTYSDFTNPDQELRKQELERTVAYIEKLSAIGAKYYRPTAGQWYEGEDEEEAIRSICSCYEACIAAAEKVGIRILMENHSVTESWERPDFVFNARRLEKTWKALKIKQVGFNYDTANAYMLRDWKPIMDTSIKEIETIHINDFDMDAQTCTVAGEGDVCIEEMLRRIFQTGFDGWISIEDVSFQGADGMKRALSNVKAMCFNAQKETGRKEYE